MADLTSKDASPSTKIVGDDETLCADVVTRSDSKKALSVDVSNITGSPGAPVLSTKLRYDITTTTLALTTSYQNILNYSGSGKFCAFSVTSEDDLIEYRLTIDSNVIFEATGTIIQKLTHNVQYQIGPCGLLSNSTGKKIHFNPQYPITYTTNVKLEAKSPVPKDVFERVLVLTKET